MSLKTNKNVSAHTLPVFKEYKIVLIVSNELTYLITSRASGKECFVKMSDTEQSSKIGVLAINQVNQKFFANATDKTCRMK